MSGYHWTHFNHFVSGGRRDDHLTGSRRSELLKGGKGDDTVEAGGGNDTVFGGNGNDLIDGGSGRDRLYGGNGRDIIDGGSGSDLINGGRGDDTLGGGDGCDIIFGGSGDDLLDGGAGSDYLDAGSGNDVVRFEASQNSHGLDLVEGGRGHDTLRLVLTQAEADDAAIQADIDRFEDFLSHRGHAWSHCGFVFRFDALNLIVHSVEALEIEIIGGVNTDPVAADDSLITDEDISASIDVLANDLDADGDALTVTAASAANGTVVIGADGTLTYTGNADFNGTDTISYTVDDGNGGTETAEVAVTVNAVNDAPLARDDFFSLRAGQSATIDLLGNDLDLDGDTLTVTSVNGQPTDGPIEVVFEGVGSGFLHFPANGQGNPTFDVTSGFESLGAPDLISTEISYTVSDGNGGSSTARVALRVSGINDAPVIDADASDLSATLVEDSATILSTTGNLVFSDLDDNELHTASVRFDGFGGDQGGITAAEAQGFLSASASEPLIGWTFGAANGHFDHLGSNESLDLTYEVTVRDLGGDTASEFVTVTVQGTNDAPVAVNDAATTDEDVAVTIDVLGNDSDVDGDTLTVTGASAANGTVVIGTDGTLTYVGDADFNGTDTISYTVDDGNGGTATAEVAVTVNAVNDAPVATDDTLRAFEDFPATVNVLGNDTDPEGDALTVVEASAGNGTVTINANGTLTYLGNANFNGPDTISYTVADSGGATATAQVVFDVIPVNDAPVAGADTAETDEDTAVTFDVLANDTDLEGDALTVESATAANGTVTVNADGSLTYLGNPDFNGTDTVTYTVRDSNFGRATGTAEINVNAVNDAPQVLVSNAIALSDVRAGDGGFIMNGIADSDLAGRGPRGAGDVNGDGIVDVIVDARHADVNGNNSGSAYVVFGKADGTAVNLADVSAGTGGFAIQGRPQGELAGSSVDGIGDLNGDGLDDLLVGAYRFSGQTGSAYVVFGKADGTTVELSDVFNGNGGFFIRPDQTGQSLGNAISSAGDVNGDGIEDLIVGASRDDANGFDSGAAFVIFGKADTSEVRISDIRSGNGGGFVIKGAAGTSGAGFSVSDAGDVNGDGLADMLVGAPLGGQGAAYVVFGKADSTAIDLGDVEAGIGGFAITGSSPLDNIGQAVSGAGDLNGDGLDDLIVGSPQSNANGVRSGIAHVIYGKADGDTVDLDNFTESVDGFSIVGASADDRAGYAVAGVGDFDGDGLDDIAVSSPTAALDSGGAGMTYIVLGTAGAQGNVDLADVENGIGGIAIFSNGVGNSVSAIGDMNNDGRADIIMGAQSENNGAPRSGGAYVVFGREATPDVVVDPDQSVAVSNISVSDVDAAEGTGEVEIVLTVGNGVLSVSGTVAVVAGNGTSELILTGDLADVNGLLDTLTYTPDPDFSGTDNLDVQVTDLGNTGLGGPLSATDSVAITVTPAGLVIESDAPVIEGGDLDDQITVTGTGGSNVAGLGGNDTILGGDGNDTLAGNDGNDTVFGGAGDDLIGDVFPENAGLPGSEPGAGDANTFVGGTGSDTLFGLDGIDDTFVFGDGDGDDVVNGFEAGAGSLDQIDLSDFGLDDFADVLAIASETGGSASLALLGVDGGVTITLNDIGIADLHQDDFIL
ncbi:MULTISPECIES: tandem-95 repeat protein [unclassified Minwuia]|jgi:Ca2+-binding RTX toxin-like protein|uniref:beta strand repeat-containing protein n=1 Tax=unclassified Minwuia TaxID=2618799 RepID=UPI0024793B6F|nr:MULTISPECIES: tandem-95 repeat protein [unclassified Minwuia]